MPEPTGASAPVATPTVETPATAEAPPATVEAEEESEPPLFGPLEPLPAMGESELEAANAKNDAGYKAYKSGDLEGAVSAWTTGVETYPNHAMLRYNLAAGLAKAFGEQGACGTTVMALKRDIISHLMVAARDPERRKRMAQDSDFDKVRHLFALQRLQAGGTLGDEAARKALAAEPLFALGYGTINTTSVLELSEDGTAETRYTSGGFFIYCGGDDSCPEGQPKKGTWTYTDGTVTLLIDGKTQELSVSQYGGVGGRVPWKTDCSA